MTPKEKAIELCDKFDEINNSTLNAAKRCALIAVEQIETITKHYPPDYMLTVYWQEVKQEINLL